MAQNVMVQLNILAKVVDHSSFLDDPYGTLAENETDSMLDLSSNHRLHQQQSPICFNFGAELQFKLYGLSQ